MAQAIEFKRGRSKSLQFKPRGFGSGARGSKYDSLANAALELDDYKETGDHLSIPVPDGENPQAIRQAVKNGIERKRDELAENWRWFVRLSDDESAVIVTVHQVDQKPLVAKPKAADSDVDEDEPRSRSRPAMGVPSKKAKSKR